MRGKRGQMVSQTMFGDKTESGIPSDSRGELSFEVADGKVCVRATGNGKGALVREFSLDKVDTIWRNGAIVFRSEPHDAGYGWEEVYLPSR